LCPHENTKGVRVNAICGSDIKWAYPLSVFAENFELLRGSAKYRKAENLVKTYSTMENVKISFNPPFYQISKKKF